MKKSIKKNITHKVSAVAFIADIREGKDVVVVWSKLSFVSSSISIENIEFNSLIMLLMLSIHCPYPHIERPPFRKKGKGGKTELAAVCPKADKDIGNLGKQAVQSAAPPNPTKKVLHIAPNGNSARND